MWKKISELRDLQKLPRNRHTRSLSRNVLVSSSSKRSLNEVYLMYYDFVDGYFHFPAYSVKWRDDVTLKPVSEIDRWQSAPRKPPNNGV